MNQVFEKGGQHVAENHYRNDHFFILIVVVLGG